MVTEMTRAAAASIQQSQFNDFLFAPIGNEKNGMLLTVLSALARLDVDPWREAASMAQMSTEAATDRMTSLITALPEKPSTVSDREAIAARLIALLPPRQVIFNPAPSKALARAGAANNYRLIILVGQSCGRHRHSTTRGTGQRSTPRAGPPWAYKRNSGRRRRKPTAFTRRYPIWLHRRVPLRDSRCASDLSRN